MRRTALVTLVLLAATTFAAAAAPAPGTRTARPRAPHAPHAADLAPALARDTLAWVGERGVTALDLVQRIEWMPWPEKSGAASMDSVKWHALLSLTAEALLARESEHRAPNGGASFARAREGLRRALARDALYRDLGAAVTPPSAAEIAALARRMHPEASAAQLPAWYRMAGDSLRTLAGQRRAAEFLVAHLAGKEARVDSATFMLLSDSLLAYMVRADVQPVQGGGFIVPTEATDVLSEALAPVLDRPLVQLPDGPLSVGDALEDMRYYLFVVRSLRPRRFAAELSGQLRLLVEGELMGREAIRRKLDQRPDARHDLETWSASWRANSQLARLVGGGLASEDEGFLLFARTHPERARAVSEVDVEEILCATREEADGVRAALDAGAPFDSLARRHSRRREWAPLGGRSGWFAVTAHPDLGYTALLSPLDSLRGPQRFPEGETIWRVRGKRLLADSLAAREELDDARSQATGEQRVDRAARYVGSLAAGVPVRFDARALSRVDILPSNMVVRRTLGFGGGMTAAPSLLPLWQWTRYAPASRTPLP